MKKNGKVKWFNDRKGFGFIEVDSGGDAFVHYTDIKDQVGHKTLREGQEVRCQVIQAPKGPKAVEVVAV